MILVTSRSTTALFSILSDYFVLCKVFMQAFEQRNLQIVTLLFVKKLFSSFKNLDVDI